VILYFFCVEWSEIPLILCGIGKETSKCRCVRKALEKLEEDGNAPIFFRTLLLSHHGVKQCFHTMDVAASYLSTKQMGPAGPTSEKAAKQMKNAAIFVAKRTKNWAWEAREV
jgi:hypothetical protein